MRRLDCQPFGAIVQRRHPGRPALRGHCCPSPEFCVSCREHAERVQGAEASSRGSPGRCGSPQAARGCSEGQCLLPCGNAHCETPALQSYLVWRVSSLPWERESPWKWAVVSCQRVPCPTLTPNSRHVGEQSHLAAGEGLVLALSMSWPVASVRPVPIMPALSLSSPETRGCTLWEAIQWCVVFLPQGLGLCCSESSPSPVITHCALNSN